MGRRDDIRTAIAEEAAERLVDQQNGKLPEAKRRELLEWLRTSPQNIEEYLRAGIAADALAAAARRSDSSLDALIADATSAADDSVIPLHRTFARVTRRRPYPPRRIVAYAAAVAVVSIGAWWALAVRDDGRFGTPLTYRTAHGEQRTSRLPDGSVLQLNTDSAVSVRLSRRERLLTLERGEAYITVSHEPSRNFRVTAGSTSVTALGTEFDVYRSGSTTTVTVVEGTVAVAPANGAAATTASTPARAVYVGAGQQVRVDDGVLPPSASAVDLRQAVGWLQRQIVFDQQPLGAIAAEFNRYSQLPVSINDPALASMLVSGVFDPFDTDSFTSLLRTIDGVDVETTATRINVTLRSAAAVGKKK